MPESDPHLRSVGQSGVPVSGHRWLVGVAIFAACTQGGYYFLRPDTPLSPDELEYAALAVSVAEDDRLALPPGATPDGGELPGDVAKRMPLYPVLLSLIYRTQPSTLWINAALMMQTFLAWCNTLLIALIAARLADDRAGILAGILASLYAPLLFLQMSLLTETLLVFLLLSAILLYVIAGLRGRSAVARLAALAGVSGLLGLAVLTRANAVVLLVPFAIDTVLRRGGATSRAVRVAIILVPALACAAGWGLRNQRAVGAFTLSTTGGLNFYLGHSAAYADNPGLDRADYNAAARLRAADPNLGEAAADRLLLERGLAFARENPSTTAMNGLRKLGVWLRPLIPSSGPMTPTLALAFVAIVGWRRFRQGRFRHRRLAVYRIALFAAPLLELYWLFQVTAFTLLEIPGVPAPLPLATPLYILSLGIPALVFLRTESRVRGLLAGVIASQLLVAIVFIPLVRIRWTVDAMLIIALAIGVANLCRWLHAGRPDARSEPRA